MSRRRPFHPLHEALRQTTDPGLYIVQSERDQTCFRIGAAGLQTGREGSLFKRLTQHNRHAPPQRNDVNWTEYYRPWDILWTLRLPGASKLTIRLAEAVLFGNFATRFSFLPESEGSGFCAGAEDGRMIREEAMALEPLIYQLTDQQARPLCRSFWKKGSREVPSSFEPRALQDVIS